MDNSLVAIFRDIPDPRSGNAIRHRLDEILTIAILAALCDFTHFTEMELFAQEREEWLRTFLELPGGIPSHDTFGDVFALTGPKEMQSRFIQWTESIREKISGEIVSIDGKTIRGSKDAPNNRKAVHVVSAWARENGIVLGEIATDEKSNEITAIPKLLRMLVLEGCVVTIDAMGTQKAIAQEIIGRGADYVLDVKDNQPALKEAVETFFERESDGFDSFKTSEKSHGRIEKRECLAYTDVGWLRKSFPDWEGLSGIGMIRSNRTVVGDEAGDASIHYVIFSKANMSAKELLYAKRSHWAVENNLHWVLDVEFGEDQSRMRVNNAAENMNVLRHMCINLIKTEKSQPKLSLNMKRKKCMLSQDYLLKVIGVN